MKASRSRSNHGHKPSHFARHAYTVDIPLLSKNDNRWAKDKSQSHCYVCRQVKLKKGKRHHCRSCGNISCGDCCPRICKRCLAEKYTENRSVRSPLCTITCTFNHNCLDQILVTRIRNKRAQNKIIRRSEWDHWGQMGVIREFIMGVNKSVFREIVCDK